MIALLQTPAKEECRTVVASEGQVGRSFCKAALAKTLSRYTGWLNDGLAETLFGETDFLGQAATFHPDFSDQRRALTQHAANYLNSKFNSFALSLCLGMRSVGTITRSLR